MPISETIQTLADRLGVKATIHYSGVCYCDGVGPMSVKELKAFLRGIDYQRNLSSVQVIRVAKV